MEYAKCLLTNVYEADTCPELTLILSGTLFSLLFGLFLTSLVSKKYSVQKIAVNATAAALSDEVFSSIRNAIAFNTQARLGKQYDKLLAGAAKFDFKLGVTISVLLAACMAIVELTYVSISMSTSNSVAVVILTCIPGACVLGRFPPVSERGDQPGKPPYHCARNCSWVFCTGKHSCQFPGE